MRSLDSNFERFLQFHESSQPVIFNNRVSSHQACLQDPRARTLFGSGHFVTALYEIEPVAGPNGSIGTLRLRYKDPEGSESKLISTLIHDEGKAFEAASNDLRFAVSVAAYGMLLRNSEHKGATSFEDVLSIARMSQGTDTEGYREGFVRMVEATRKLSAGDSIAARR